MPNESNSKDAKKNGASVEQMVDPGKSFLPDVDVVENGDDLALYIDPPGVAPGGANVEADENNILTVRAKNVFREPEGGIFRQALVGDYYRAFQLGSEFDRNRISAQLKDGVLILRIPKREEARVKRIEITA
ncbi:MAG: Hsp20/alpha crystallin family protein [Fibrobacteria bacterium]